MDSIKDKATEQDQEQENHFSMNTPTKKKGIPIPSFSPLPTTNPQPHNHDAKQELSVPLTENNTNQTLKSTLTAEKNTNQESIKSTLNKNSHDKNNEQIVDEDDDDDLDDIPSPAFQKRKPSPPVNVSAHIPSFNTAPFSNHVDLSATASDHIKNPNHKKSTNKKDKNTTKMKSSKKRPKNNENKENYEKGPRKQRKQKKTNQKMQDNASSPSSYAPWSSSSSSSSCSSTSSLDGGEISDNDGSKRNNKGKIDEKTGEAKDETQANMASTSRDNAATNIPQAKHNKEASEEEGGSHIRDSCSVDLFQEYSFQSSQRSSIATTATTSSSQSNLPEVEGNAHKTLPKQKQKQPPRGRKRGRPPKQSKQVPNNVSQKNNQNKENEILQQEQRHMPASSTKQGRRGHPCALCFTCTCRGTTTKDAALAALQDHHGISAAFANQQSPSKKKNDAKKKQKSRKNSTHAETERALLARLAKLEKTVSWFQHLTGKVSRELRRHRRLVMKEAEAFRKLQEDPNEKPSRFLQDVVEVEDEDDLNDEGDEDKVPPLSTAKIAMAQKAVFSSPKEYQPTLTQLYTKMETPHQKSNSGSEINQQLDLDGGKDEMNGQEEALVPVVDSAEQEEDSSVRLYDKQDQDDEDFLQVDEEERQDSSPIVILNDDEDDCDSKHDDVDRSLLSQRIYDGQASKLPADVSRMSTNEKKTNGLKENNITVKRSSGRMLWAAATTDDKKDLAIKCSSKVFEPPPDKIDSNRKKDHYYDTKIRCRAPCQKDDAGIVDLDNHMDEEAVLTQKSDGNDNNTGVDSLLDLFDVAPEAGSSETLQLGTHLNVDKTLADEVQKLEACGKLQRDSVEVNERDNQEDFCYTQSQLSQGGEGAAQAIIDRVLSEPSKVNAIEAVCPEWKENVRYAYRRTDESGIRDAVCNVRSALDELEQQKLRMEKEWSGRQLVLELYLQALQATLERRSDHIKAEHESEGLPASVTASEEPPGFSRAHFSDLEPSAQAADQECSAF